MFTTVNWKHLGDINIARLRLSGAIAYSSLESFERYLEQLRRIYPKVQFRHPTLHPTYNLCIAVKTINDIMGRIGLYSPD